MILGLDNLKAGLRWWRRGAWPRDVHNADYYDIYDASQRVRQTHGGVPP